MLVCFEAKNIDVEQRHDLKARKKEMKRRFERESKTRNQRKEKGWMEKSFQIESFGVVLS